MYKQRRDKMDKLHRLQDLLVLILLVCEVSHAQTKHGLDYTICSGPPQSPPGITRNKPRPSLPQDFHVNVECVIRNKNKTTNIEEYSNPNTNRGFIKQTDVDTEFDVWYDHTTNEFIRYYPNIGNCSAKALPNGQRYLFGYRPVAGKSQIFTLAGALHFGSNAMSEVYMGQTSVRGIAVDWWSSCQYWQDMDATMVVDWYFTSQAYWSTAVGMEVPVRAHVRGIVHDTATSSHFFEHYYEFFQFEPYQYSEDSESKNVFATPRGIQCPGRVFTKPFPQLPQDAFSFSTEIIDKIKSSISIMKETFDFVNKLVKYEYRPMGADGTPTDHDVVTVHDFNAGFAYTTDQVHGNCSVQRLQDALFDSKHLSGSQNLHMRTPAEVFYSENASLYTYEGLQRVRDIDCDYWVGHRQDFPTVGAGLNSTFEWYFAKNEWQTTNPGLKSGGIPILMRVSIEGELSVDYNIYNFKNETPNPVKFDISPCYTHLQRRKFQLKFQGSAVPTVDSNLKRFKLFLIGSIANIVGIRPIRIANLRVSYDADVVVRFDLLDVPPIKGDIDKKDKEVPLSVAANTLVFIVKQGQFEVFLGNGFGNLHKLVAKSNSIVDITNMSMVSRTTNSPQQSSSPLVHLPGPSTTSGPDQFPHTGNNATRLKCVTCHDVSSVKFCDLFLLCKVGQVCSVEKYHIGNGHVKYQAGCAYPTSCSTEDRKRKPPEQSLCSSCCQSDFCNNRGCGDAGIASITGRGPVCLDCDGIGNIDDCDKINICEEDEVCSIEEYRWGPGGHRYTLGCKSKLRCPNEQASVYRLQRRATPSCTACCSTDYCNTNCTVAYQPSLIG